jgi:hypothetical protein
MDGFSSFFSVNKKEYDKQAGTVVRVALTAFNKSSIDDLMMQKAVADRIHTLVGDVAPSNAVVSQVSALLADHSQRYDTSSKPRSDLFVVDVNPNISVFDSLACDLLPPFGNDCKIPDSTFTILRNAISCIDTISYLVALRHLYPSMHTFICLFRCSCRL